jgi:GH24 family phage-related lysozyme (muramidase)
LSPAPAVPGTTLAREKLRTFQLLRQYESFSSDAYWDVNAWRVGYGQDTILGNSVYRGMRVSRSTAERAMVSRWSRWERPALIQQIGTGTFASLNADQRAVLMSLKWNYGKVPSRVVRAVNRGSCEGVADSIHTLRWHDRGINAWRRGSESKIYLQSCGSAYHRA